MTSIQLTFTKHAAKRCQQRGISQDAVHVLYRYGKRQHTYDGGVSYAMDKKTRRTAKKDMGETAYRRIESQLDSYIIVKLNGVLVTAAHRLERLRTK